MSYHIHVIDVQNALQNYIWLIEHRETRQTVIIDPTDGQLVLDFCAQNDLIPAQIWLTHWHKDHIAGVPAITALYPIPVYGPRDELSKISFISDALIQDDQFYFADLKVEVIATPGHTLGHICYFVDEIDCLFSGDTLFAMGCGRLFEGTPEQMYHSLNRLAALPAYTQVYCSHEYTLSNAKFALTIEPENLELIARAKEVQTLRDSSQITLPSTIEAELATNPFLRAQSLDEFIRIRKLKDSF